MKHLNPEPRNILILALLVLTTFSCRDPKPQTLFTLLPSSKTGITFNNLIKETEVFNVLEYGYFYNGGGVAIGDINNDSLPDIYFTGNMVASHLYLNKGNWQFEEIAQEAGVAAAGLWNTGATMVDLNDDGYLDIYVCRSAAVNPMNRRNLLFINNGDLTFTEHSVSAGLADPGYSTQAAFFDYDRDGDLDMYLLNHSLQKYAGFSNLTPTLKERSDRNLGDKLFRNDGIIFTDVTRAAGIKTNVLGFGLGIAVSDVNNDGWPDIYVSNDYNEEDYLYINNQDGTFSDQLKDYMAYVSLFSMGSDIADINNDGFVDIMTLDMLPEDNYRQKLMLGPDNYDKYQRMISSGFHKQSMRNMLQLNQQGAGFSEIGQMAGVSNTDWSWASLFADFDNDGHKDLFVSNGYQRDYTNMDFMNFMVSEKIRENAGGVALAPMETINQMPSILVSNYIYQNQGDLTFKKKTQEWGLNEPSLSHGAAYADLDNDGDLDLVVNNTNGKAFVYRNNSRQMNENNYLKVKLKGDSLNTFGVGSRVTLFCGEQQFSQEMMPSRGFQSAVDSELVFGLGEYDKIDRIEVQWANGQSQQLVALPVNQTITIDQKQAADDPENSDQAAERTWFSKSDLKIFNHQENPFVDFKQQQLLPHKLSTQGPKIAVADVNGDGLDDFYIGGAKGQSGQLLLQNPSENFTVGFESESEYEDVGALLFDSDQDGDMDLYVVSGGADFKGEESYLQDRLYRNLGAGKFERDTSALPAMLTSGSSVSSADFDGDGDLDLFVGGRLVPGLYPQAPRSYLLENDGAGNFQDITEKANPELLNPGMVSDVIWTDINGDQQADLVLVGEWMPVRMFQNDQGRLKEVTSSSGTENLSGWWNCLEAADLDNDGDMDLVLGNFGWNSQIKASAQEPVELYVKDFDNNGTVDPILCYYQQGKSYPAFSKDDLEGQLPLIKKKYVNYSDYADQTMADIFSTQELQDAAVLKANEFSSGFLENQGDGTFKFSAFPIDAQLSPVYGILIDDFDNDGTKDVVLGGNFNGSRVKFGEYQGSLGTVLKGIGKGEYVSWPIHKSGLVIKGEVRDIAPVKKADEDYWLLWVRNNNEVLVYQQNPH